jgi:hypothetical protein
MLARNWLFINQHTPGRVAFAALLSRLLVGSRSQAVMAIRRASMRLTLKSVCPAYPDLEADLVGGVCQCPKGLITARMSPLTMDDQ